MYLSQLAILGEFASDQSRGKSRRTCSGPKARSAPINAAKQCTPPFYYATRKHKADTKLTGHDAKNHYKHLRIFDNSRTP